MKKRRVSETSESEESEKEQNVDQPSTSRDVTTYNGNSSSNSSSESEEPREPPPPPVDARKRKSSTSASPKKNVTFNPIEKLVAENKNLKKLEVDDVVSNEDDVCLLEVPKTIDPSEFLERVIHFDRKTKLKLNKTKYLTEPSVEDIKAINLLTRKVRIIHPISVLRMRQYNKFKQNSEGVNEVTTPPVLPSNLKMRHPLFGSDFKGKIVLDEEIERKLDITISNVVKKIKQKKHKKVDTGEVVAPVEHSGKKKKQKKKVYDDSEFEQDKIRDGNVEEPIFTLLETHIAKKSKKGHKKEKHEGMTSFSDSGVFAEEICSEYEQNRKRKKSVKESEDVEREQKRKHKNIIKERDASNEHEFDKKHKSNDFEETMRQRKNSQKEGRHSQGGSSSFYNNFDENKKLKNIVKQEPNESIEWESNYKLEKKKKHKSSIHELSQDNGSFMDNSFEDNTPKKKKKHHQIKKEKSNSEHGQKSEDADESLKRKGKNSTKKGAIMREHEENYAFANDTKPERKSRSSFINSTVMPGVQLPLFEFDVSGIHNSSKNEETPEEEKSHKDRRKNDVSFESVEKKGKKKIKKEIVEQLEESEPNEEAISPRKRKKKADSEDEHVSSPKKKRKQIKRELDDANDHEGGFQTNSLILNLLNKVKSEMDTSVNEKKKKK